jgi:enoyl-CoA hydratase/carnithine racemase
MSLVQTEQRGAVRHVVLDRPEKRNAFNADLVLAVGEALRAAADDPATRCVVLRGEGPMFSSGMDLGALADLGQTPDVLRPFRRACIEAWNIAETMEKPVVAQLHGACIGGALELALACDLRVAAGTIALAMPPAKLGLVYSHTGIRKFIETIGAPRTRELFLTGRRIDARTAREWGLINAIAEEGRIAEESVELAREIAANAPLAQRGNKRVINAVLSARTAMDPNLERELIELRRACFASEDFREGVRAFSEKRVPRWRGR